MHENGGGGEVAPRERVARVREIFTILSTASLPPSRSSTDFYGPPSPLPLPHKNMRPAYINISLLVALVNALGCAIRSFFRVNQAFRNQVKI